MTLDARAQEGNEVREGSLSCACGKVYPIRGGIPEFVAFSYTQSFSFQWQAQETDLENEARSRKVKTDFLAAVGIDPPSLRGLRALDAGCGRGVLLGLLAESKVEAVGMDLSDGILVAASRVVGRERGDVVRGDILLPPFSGPTFDAIFSLGALHHTPDCRKAVLSLARLLRPGGVLAIWVYSAYSRYRNACSDLLRRATTRMPHRLLYALCHLAVPLNWLQGIPLLGLPFRVIPVAGDGPWRWVVLGTFDWYSPRYQSKHTFPEVFRWFEEAGLEQIRVHDWGIAVSGRRPLDSGPIC